MSGFPAWSRFPVLKWTTVVGLVCTYAQPRVSGWRALYGGSFSASGGMNPSGHAAVYFSSVCAETPVRVRHCERGESGSSSAPRSRANRGMLEALLKSTKYAVPLAVLHPLITGTLAIAYLTQGGRDSKRHFARDMTPQSQPEVILASLQANRIESDLRAVSNR